MFILQAYKLRTKLVDRGHRHARIKYLDKGSKTILPALWFAQFYQKA